MPRADVLIKEGKMQLKTKTCYTNTGPERGIVLMLHARKAGGGRLLIAAHIVAACTTRQEQLRQLEIMCDIFATQQGNDYRLDRKHTLCTPIPEQTKEK